MNLKDLINVINGKTDIIMVDKNGKSVHFKAEEVGRFFKEVNSTKKDRTITISMPDWFISRFETFFR